MRGRRSNNKVPGDVEDFIDGFCNMVIEDDDSSKESFVETMEMETVETPMENKTKRNKRWGGSSVASFWRERKSYHNESRYPVVEEYQRSPDSRRSGFHTSNEYRSEARTLPRASRSGHSRINKYNTMQTGHSRIDAPNHVHMHEPKRRSKHLSKSESSSSSGRYRRPRKTSSSQRRSFTPPHEPYEYGDYHHRRHSRRYDDYDYDSERRDDYRIDHRRGQRDHRYDDHHHSHWRRVSPHKGIKKSLYGRR